MQTREQTGEQPTPTTPTPTPITPTPQPPMPPTTLQLKKKANNKKTK